MSSSSRPVVDPRKARLYIDGVGDAEVLDAFIDPRNGRWAYRLRMVSGDAAHTSRIIYPDQILSLQWSLRGEAELEDGDAAGDPAGDAAPPPLLGGGSAPSLSSRILHR